MRLRTASRVVTWVLLLFACGTALAPLAAAGLPMPAVPAIPYHQRTLANGLQVFSVEDRSSSDVAVQMWYRVGSRNDPPGRPGLASLLQQLAFKRPAHACASDTGAAAKEKGGARNASSDEDVTRYDDVAPASCLETLLRAEAGGLASLDVDPRNFASGRALAEEAYRQRVLAQPHGPLFSAIDAYSYAQYPYRRPAIGSLAGLQAASLRDVMNFHKTYYRPDNAALIVVGNFDPAQLDAWVDRYFGGIARPPLPLPRVDAREPARRKHERRVVTDVTAPQPAVALTWLIPPAADAADALALQVAAALLAQGDSSRLYRSLVYRHQVARQVGADASGRIGPGLLTLYAVLVHGRRPAEAEKLLDEEIIWLATQPIQPAELARVKTQLLADALAQRRTPQGVALALGRAALIDGNPERVNTDPAALQKITAKDVHRALRKYVIDARSITIDYLPQAGATVAGRGAAK